MFGHFATLCRKGLNGQQIIFYENEFYQNSQAYRFAQKPFNIPENVAFEETLILPNGIAH